MTSVSTQPRALSHPPGWVLFPSLPVVLIWRALVPHAISCVTSQPTAADSICLYGTPTTRHWTNATLPQFLFASRILFEHENMAQERPRLDTERFGKGADLSTCGSSVRKASMPVSLNPSLLDMRRLLPLAASIFATNPVGPTTSSNPSRKARIASDPTPLAWQSLSKLIPSSKGLEARSGPSSPTAPIRRQSSSSQEPISAAGQ